MDYSFPQRAAAEEALLADLAPEYGHGNELPAYESSISTPIAKFSFRRIDGGRIALETTDPSMQYSIIRKSGWRSFSSAPSSALTLQVGDQLPVSSNNTTMTVASMQFDNTASFPWMPRALVRVDVAGSGVREVRMECANLSDWTFSWRRAGDGDDAEWDAQRLSWRLDKEQTSLVLMDEFTGLCVARFRYSAYGAAAKKGLPMGELEVYGVGAHGLPLEAVICSCDIVMRHWLNLGRHYRQHT